MPIPLLFIGVTAITGALGVGKGVKAGVDQKEANRTNKRANSVAEKATRRIEEARKNCGAAINNLGEKKIDILDNSIKVFVREVEKISNIEFSGSQGLNELGKLTLDKKSFGELKELQAMASSVVKGVLSGGVAGSLTAFGAYGAAGVLATASTGTAIGTLSGAAATNATLAFFGGGSLAAGGLGMAGGTLVLGGLVTGPALAVLGFVVGAKASKNKDEAYSNLAKAKKFQEEMETAAVMCSGIRRRANMFTRFLISLNSIFEPLVYDISRIIIEKGTDFQMYSEKEQETIMEAYAMAGSIKTILDTPILTPEGSLSKESETIVELTRNKLGI